MESDPSPTVAVKGRLLEQHSLYSPQTLLLLRQAVQHAESMAADAAAAANTGGRGSVNYPSSTSSSVQLPPRKSRYADSSSSEDEKGEENDEDSASESESSSSDGEGENKTCDPSEQQQLPPLVEEDPYQDEEQKIADTKKDKTPLPKSKKKQNIPKNQRERQQTVRRFLESLSCFSVPLPKAATTTADSMNTVLELPISLLSKADRQEDNNLQSLRSFLSLATTLQEKEKTVLVFALRSGRFAAAVYSVSKSSSGSLFQCLQHTTSTRYTVRKGQGKAQSAQDSQRRPKSVGSQLRRAGEEQLKEDVAQCLQQWKHYLKSAAIIFISCPKTMNKTMFPGDTDTGNNDGENNNKGEDSTSTLLKRKDPRIRRVPLDIGRPSFEAIGIIHDVLTTITVREEVIGPVSTFVSLDNDIETTNTLPTKPVSTAAAQASKAAPAPSVLAKKVLAETTGIVLDDDAAAQVLPLTALHIAAKNGDFSNIQELVQKRPDTVNTQAGPCFMTPLHYAAQSTEGNNNETSGAAAGDTDAADDGKVVVDVDIAADVVYYLLTTGKADPCLVDSRNRPPYFLASAPAVRDAFRRARATLGEDHCAWDDEAKVGPALSEADLQLRKEKEAEKKRKKKQRQKEKKAQEKAQTAAEEAKEKELQEKARQEEEAKRIRDGLQPKPNAAGNNVCDFCQTVCKGRRRNEMLQRLEYVYCSTDCVQKHKRELMAAAALSRFEK